MRKIISIIKIFFSVSVGLLFALSASAANCPTASPSGVGCGANQYYCGGSCLSMTSCPTWDPSPICADGLTCDNCNRADACGVCSRCANTTTHTLCGTYPNKVCQLNTTPPSNCKTYNQCTSVCSACNDGYYLDGNQCIQAVLKLGPDSVSGLNVVQSANNTLMYIGSNGVSIGTSTISTVFNVDGVATLSSDLSMAHNKSIQLNDASTSTVLLIGNYGDSHGFGYGTSTPRTASLAIEGDVKANRLCIKEDCRAEWTDIQGVNYWTLNGANIYNNNSGNVGINDNTPANRLSVSGHITGSDHLTVGGNGTFMKNLGIGNIPSFTDVTFDHYSDLSGKDHVAYLARTSGVVATILAGENGTPPGADFGYVGSQMTLGTLTKHPLNFIIGGKSRMFLSDDGKLGIGTVSPTEMLDVNGGARIGTINNATGDIVTVSTTGVLQKRTAEQLRGDIGAAKEINSLYYVEGNTTGTAGTWTGSIDGLTAYYDGLTIAYKIGIAGASGLTLDINNLGAKAVRRNTAALTTHLPVGTVVVLTYTTIDSIGYWVWADYDSDSGLYYLRWNGPNVIAGEQITRYKIVMEGHDGRFYPITTGNSTAVNGKTISSAKFKMNGQILWYNTTTVINEDSLITSTNLYSDYYHATRANYTFNKLSDWTAGKAVYLVGTIDNDGYFVLDGAGSIGTDFLLQDIPTTDNGKIYILLGYMTNTTSGFKLTPDRVAYHFKDGKIRLYESMSGTGSANYITKWASSTALGNSQIYDNGTNVGIGTNNPSSTLHVVGVTTLSNDLSMVHNKSIQLNDASADTVLLIGNYGDGQGFVYGTSTLRTASLAVEGDVKANRLCIKEDCRAEWTDIQGVNYWTASSTNIYSNNTGNVGIGDIEPTNKLSVSGNITGSGSLRITGTATSSNYFASNLGIGGLPGGYWNRLVDLSGSGNSAYISRTGSTHAIMAASDTGTPVGTGYDFTYPNHQMVLGTITNHPINFITNKTSKMFLTADGKLGIGTTTPNYKLHIKDQIDSGREVFFAGETNDDAKSGFYVINGTINDGEFRPSFLGYKAGDNKSPLTFYGQTISTYDTGSEPLIRFSANRKTGDRINGSNSSIVTRPIVQFLNYNDPLMTILANGNVGINTTNPQQKLDVSGKIALDGTTIAYRPTAFTGTLILGDGGTNLQTGADYNTFVGIGAGANNTTGQRNTALGRDSLRLNTTGSRNTANGMYSLYSNTTGGYNTANGMYSLYSNTTGGSNTANGSNSLYSNTTGNYNTANGYYSLSSNTTGSQNTANGYNSGRYIADGTTGRSTGDNGLYLGYNSMASDDGTDNEIVIGANAVGKGSNTASYGNSSMAKHIFEAGNVGIGTTTPEAKLDVNGNIAVRGTMALTGTLYTGGGAKLLAVDNTGNVITTTTPAGTSLPSGSLSQTLRYGSSGWESTSTLIVNNSSNVGIGTTTPESKLDVNGSLAVRGAVSLTGPSYINQGSRLLMVDNSGAVSVTSTIPGGGGDYVSKTGDTMTGGLTFENIPAPGAAIDLNGLNIVGVNKITVTTIDPLYDIGGTKYSTYAPSVVGGVKEEYIGRGQISRCGVDVCSWRLDFSKVAIGSDLWVWRKIVEFNSKTIDVVMTAYGRPALLSYEIKDNQLIFYADRPTEFSYRLIGPRFDWRKWPTLAEDQSEKASLTIE
jgi:hypothetical protein